MTFKYECPVCKDECTEFLVSALVSEEWVVDNKGNFLAVFDRDEAAEEPKADAHYTCRHCGRDAKRIEVTPEEEEREELRALLREVTNLQNGNLRKELTNDDDCPLPVDLYNRVCRALNRMEKKP